MTQEEHAAHTRRYYHDSAATIKDELQHLIEEFHRICKLRNIPYVLVFEEALTPKGSQVSVNGWFDETRAESSGLPGRFMLMRVATHSSASDMTNACRVLHEAGCTAPSKLKL